MRSDWLIQVSYAVRYNNFLPPSTTFWNYTGPIGFIHTGEKKKRKKEKLLHNLQNSIRSELATVLSFATSLASLVSIQGWRIPLHFLWVLIGVDSLPLQQKNAYGSSKRHSIERWRSNFFFLFFSPLALHKSTSSSSSHQTAKRTSNRV